VVPHEGGRIFISVHDAEYLRQKAEWKRKLAQSHPDVPSGSAFAFRHLIKQRDKWEAEEVAWYATHGLTTPDDHSAPAPPQPTQSSRSRLVTQASGRVSRGYQLRAYLAQFPNATDPEILTALGITKCNLWRIRHMLKHNPPRRPQEDRCAARVVELLADGRPHSASELSVLSGFVVNSIFGAVRRLRYRGFDIVTIKRSKSASFYQLIAGQPA
jgi:hypothetical protein